MIRATRLSDVTRSVADRWLKQYGKDTIKILGPKTWQQVHAELVALGPDPTVEQIYAVTGSRSWTSLDCQACDAVGLDVVVTIGREPDYDSATATVCPLCLSKALLLCVLPDP